MNKDQQATLTKITTSIGTSMRTEGTSGSPRKFTLTEISDRVNLAFLTSPNDELEALVLEVVTE